ncbi:TetR/AcrR family transcriptional regulator [Actinocatenispora rupis]|uniref:TetR family transcriptional regulator n=1 Tax=Actinocatenispora rupis TaxID=519421 RepID=A0A8J3J9M4_9ACTN|nr:TetR/AcrR family transcriptional regulator [Actinocatenispora rupis]GID12624.1 TetR family transcriptional regulator [Actinocatenispora rupis]
MARRGDELRDHILRTAKDVFLETGYERASMDVVATRATTSKRSLYAHFPSKDALFLAVVDLTRELYLDRLKTPGHYSDDPREAVVLFCGRFQQMLLWRPALRTCRLGITEAERLPDAAARYHDAIFASAHQRLADYLRERYELDHAEDAAHELLGRSAYPRFVRALFGVEEPIDDWPDEAAVPGLDLDPIRTAAARLLP